VASYYREHISVTTTPTHQRVLKYFTLQNQIQLDSNTRRDVSKTGPGIGGCV